jgi:hypothetical protein
VFAQFTSNVQGTVTDPSGAVVEGAVVTLTNTETNASQDFTTSKSGQYFFNRLAPGSYRVVVRGAGFKELLRAVQLTTEQTAGIDLQLSVGATTDSVTITAEDSHGINSDETRVQYTLSAREIEEFPLQNQATLGLLRAAPGVTGIDEGHNNVAINRDTASESANGRGISSNLFLLDFIPINSELAGTSGLGSSGGYINVIPHPDMVAEISLQTTTFSVENGAGSGIQTSITTKSGTNKFHGDGDYTYTGGPFAANTGGSSSQVFRRQYVSGALGGPIWKDRTFFFGSYFNQQNATPNSGYVTFYDPQFIAWAHSNYPRSANITQGLMPYPADRAVNPKAIVHGSDMTGYNFVNFGVVACGSTPTAPNLIPVPCNLPIWDQATFGAPQTDNGTQYNFRLDHSLREGKDRLYASFFRFDQQSIAARVQSSFDGATPSTGYYLAANYTHAFTSSLLNEASFGETRYFFNYTTTPHSTSQLLLPYLSGCTCAGLNQIQFLETELEHQTYGRDSISWVKGKHNFTFGIQGAFNNEFSDKTPTYGKVFFQAAFFYLDYLNDYSDLEDIYTLSANVNNHPGKFIPQLFGAESVRFGLYGQDAWKVTPNLLLTYGVRWDDFGNPSPYGANAEGYANVKLASGSSFKQQVGGLSVGLVNNVYASSRVNNILPRGGFAYTVPGNHERTVIHGGIGLYEDDLNLNDVSSNLSTQPPVRLSYSGLGRFSTPQAVNSYGTTIVQGLPGGNPYGFQFPSVSIYGYSSLGAPLDVNGKVVVGDLFGVDPNLKAQNSILYNLGAEQELPGKLVVGVLYSGSDSYNQIVTTDVNTCNGCYSAGAPVVSNGVTGLTNSQFGHIKYYRNAGVGNYNALIATVRQTIGRLTYQASYTWGKGLSDPTNNWTDQQDIHSQYTNSNGDARQRFTLTQVYEVPANFASKLMNESLAGWAISNAIVGQTGQPFTVASTSGSYDFNNDGNNYDIPLYKGTKYKFTRSDAHTSFFNQSSLFSGAQAAFGAPSPDAEGGKQNMFFGPGYFTLDTGLSKKMQVPWFGGERANLILRVQAINLLNHQNLNSIDGSYDDTTTVGEVTSTHQGRILQLGGRFQF